MPDRTPKQSFRSKVFQQAKALFVQDAFTNRDLAENPTWLSAVTYVECSFCHYLSHSASGLTETSAPCPNCAASGEPRIVFPDLSTRRLLEMVAYFYLQAGERLSDIQNELRCIVSEKLDHHFDWDSLAQTATAIHEFRRTKGMIDTTETFEQLLGMMQVSLGLRSAKEASKVFPLLFGYSGTTEEHQVVVLLATAMLEKLFKGLLSRMLAAASLNGSTAKRSLKKFPGHEDQKKLFQELTGECMETAITSVGSPTFYSNWQSIRDARNEFMHGSSFAIGADAAEEAFDVAKESFGVFAELHNEFCIHRT